MRPLPTEPELRASFLAENLALLAASQATRELVESSEPAVLRESAPGSWVIDHAAGVLGGLTDEARIRAECPPGSETPIVVFGLGAGDTVQAIRKITDVPVVIYEPLPGVARAALEGGPSLLGDVTLTCTLHDLLEVWPGAARGHAGALIVRTPGYREALPERYGELERAVVELVKRTGINNATHRLRARTWVQDMFANVPLLQEAVPFLVLRERFVGVPAFIVGAGPSLGKNGHLLGEAVDKGLMIAVNSSARALATRGVTPQVLCCIESLDVSHLLEPLPFIDRVARAFSLSAHPRTLRSGRGPLLPIWEAIPEIALPLERLTGLPGLAVSGSVSTIAFSLAFALGCSPIVLLGQDLAYTGERAYAEGTAYEASRVRSGSDGRLHIEWCDAVRATRARGALPIHESEPLEEVPAWGGAGSVPSGPSFAGPRAWFAAAAEALERAGVSVELVNATEGGSHIAGWSERALADVLAGREPRNITSASLAAAATLAGDRVSPACLTRWARGEMESARRVGRAARDTRKRARRALDAMLSDCAGSVPAAFTRLESAEQRLRDAVQAAPSVDAWAFAPLDQFMEKRGAEDDPRRLAEVGLRDEASVARVIETAAREVQNALSPLAHGRTSPESSHRIQGEGSPCPS